MMDAFAERISDFYGAWEENKEKSVWTIIDEFEE